MRRAENRSVGNYDEMTTARLTWLVLDRLVPPDEEAYARSALIARDPELRRQVDHGLISEEKAIAQIRARQTRHRDPDDSVIWIRRPLTALAALILLAFLAVSLLH